MFLCALVTLAMPSRAAAQEPSSTVPSYPDSLSCLTRGTVLDTARDSLPPDSTRSTRGSGAALSRGPAIILRATASAREVRFASQPRIRVRLCGGVLDSVRIVERRNLPDPVQPGVTYRDVFIAVEILGHLDAECLASRITGSGAARADPCASIQARDTTGAARRAPP